MADILKLLGLKRSKEPEVRTSGYHGPMPGKYGRNLTVPWGRATNRKKLEEDLIVMDQNDGIVARIFDHITDYATCFEHDEFFGFKVVTGQERGTEPTAIQTRAVGIVNDMVQRTQLQGQLTWDIVRDMVRKGNVFTETVMSPDNHIVAVKPFPYSWQIEKNLDDSGNLKTGDPAQAVRDPKMAYDCAYCQVSDIGSVMAAFWPYQIVHWGFGHMSANKYYEALGAPGIKNWKRLEAGRDSLGVARIIRAWDTNIHVIPMPAGLSRDEVSEKIREYQYNNERDEITTYDSSSGNFQSTPRSSPTDVARDIYVPSFYTSDGKTVSGDVKKLQPSTAALSELADIYFAMNVMICTFGVPIEILGLDIGNKPMVDKTKEEGMEAFSKFIKRLQFSHAYGLKTLFDMELLLSGVDPRQQLYRIVYPGITPQSKETEAKISMTLGQTATYYYTIGMPPELIGPTLNLDTKQIAIWKANLEQQIAAQQAIAKAQAKTTTPPNTQQKQQPKPKE